MHIATSLLMLTVWADIAFTEVNVPTFNDLLDSHCAYQCHTRQTETNHRAREMGDSVNVTQVDEIVEEELTNLAKSLQPLSCQDVDPRYAKLIKSNGGIYDIYPLGLTVMEVHCDTTTDGGGWTVIQKRVHGSVDFFRGWYDYVNGFGNAEGDLWLGLEAIYQMTKRGDHELRIDMIQINRTHRYAGYRNFSIGPSSDYYRLSVGGYYGNATDALADHNNQMFSTKDSDHDEAITSSCAQSYKGGWWYSKCYDSNLNGVFSSYGNDGIRWWWKIFPKESLHIRHVEMKIRKKQ